MQSGRFYAILSLIAPLALPASVLAQGSSGAQLFTSFDSSLPGDGMAGFGLTLGGGSLALRGSFGLSYSTFSTATATRPKEPSRWTGDVDLILPDRAFGLASLFGGAFHPYGFVGIGARSIESSPTLADATKTWSYGGGLSVPLGSALAIAGEYRARTQLSSAVLTSPTGLGGNSEFRLGLDFHFGGKRSASSGVGLPRGGSSGTVWPAGNNAAGAARRVVPRGERYIGVPYVWGGETPKGFDCSGFVQYVYRAEGVELPRTSRQMAGSGFGVSRAEMAIGDLMLFAESGEAISHVAIYAGNGRFIHSSSSGNGVRYDDLNSGRGAWFRQNLVAVRRVATGSGAAIASFAKSLIPFEGFDPPDKAPPVKR
jgi:cell wall-associated NlpC family hydrolase